MSWQAVVLIIFGGIVVLGVIAIIAVWAMWSKASERQLDSLARIVNMVTIITGANVQISKQRQLTPEQTELQTRRLAKDREAKRNG